MFSKKKSLLYLQQLHLFDQKYSKTVILWNITAIKFFVCESSVSRDPSELILIRWFDG